MASLKNTTISSNGYLKYPAGTTAQRPTAAVGMQRYNSTIGDMESYQASNWANTNAGSYVKEGLITHLDAGNTASYPGTGTTWYDLSGNANHCSLVSCTFSSANGGSIVFNGSSSVGNMDSRSVACTSQITLEYWAYVTNYSGGSIFLANNSTSGNESFYIANVHHSHTSTLQQYWDAGGSGPFAANPGAGTGYDRISKPYSSADSYGSWQHWVYTKNINTEYMAQHRNGRVMLAGNYRTLMLSIPNSIRVGYNTPGNIGVVRIYDRELTLSEIKQNFEAEKARYGVS